jgi:cyclohexanone monooxygenase
VVANGVEYEIDCLIYATGFEVGTGYARRAGYEVYGRGGQSLTERWAEGVSTLHGFLTHGFPNCFIISNSQSGFTVNYPHMLNEQSKHVAYMIGRCLEGQVREAEVSPAAEAHWVDTVMANAVQRQAFAEECTPGYYNNEGMPSPEAARNAPFGGGSIAFIKILEAWRAQGDMEGVELR